MNRKQLTVAWILSVWTTFITVVVGIRFMDYKIFWHEILKAWAVFCLPALFLGGLLIYTLRSSNELPSSTNTITKGEPGKEIQEKGAKNKVLNRYQLFLFLLILRALLTAAGAENSVVSVIDLTQAGVLLYIIVRLLLTLPARYTRWRAKQGS